MLAILFACEEMLLIQFCLCILRFYQGPGQKKNIASALTHLQCTKRAGRYKGDSYAIKGFKPKPNL